MLDGAGDAQSHIDLGVDGLAGLADLVVGGHPACVGHGTGSAHDAVAQGGSQLLSQGDALLHILGDAAAHRDDDVGADQVHQLAGGLLHAQDLGLDVVCGQGESGLDDLAGIRLGLVEGSLLHDAGTDGGHLRAEAGADDGRHQVAAESRTGHLQVAVLIVEGLLGQVDGGALRQELDVLLGVDVQVGGVSGQAGVQTGGTAGAQVAADVGRADQQHLGLVLVDHIADHLGVSVGGVVLQQGALADHDLVCAVAAQLLGDGLHMIAQQQAGDFAAQLVGQLAGLADQLEVGGHQCALPLLAEDPHALVFLKISHCNPAPFVRSDACRPGSKRAAPPRRRQ